MKNAQKQAAQAKKDAATPKHSAPRTDDGVIAIEDNGVVYEDEIYANWPE